MLRASSHIPTKSLVPYPGVRWQSTASSLFRTHYFQTPGTPGHQPFSECSTGWALRHQEFCGFHTAQSTRGGSFQGRTGGRGEGLGPPLFHPDTLLHLCHVESVQERPSEQ